MSQPTSLTKIIYDPSFLKTPNVKDVPKCSDQNEDETYNYPILMDEFGQTPDHFYLAKNPSPFFQVKRKLNLQSSPSPEEGVRKSTRRRRKLDPKPKAKKVTKTRYDTSLGQLTKKFLKLLSDATDGVINLNTACSLLCVPKRRLYDITNVLEGAGLIQKTSRNNIKWKGQVSSLSYDLEREIDILEAKENKLDELIYHIKSELKVLKQTEENYLYVTSDDLFNIEDRSRTTLIGIKLPSGEQIIEPSENKVRVTSKTSELNAFLLSEDVSVVDILHPTTEFKENSYKLKISDNQVHKSVKEELLLIQSDYGYLCESPTTRQDPVNAWRYGKIMTDAFITDEDDIAPLSRNVLFQTEDQDLELPFPNLELEDNYSFSLDHAEGLADLFD